MHVLSETVATYLERVRVLSPEIESIWLIGSRANPTTEPPNDWDLLVFANPTVLERLQALPELECEEKVDLLIVVDGDRFECPWPRDDRENARPKCGKLYDTDSEYNFGWDQLS